MQNISTIIKPLHGSPEWLRVRWKNENNEARISASIAAVIHDEHQYKNVADLAMELLSSEPPTPIETNDAMERGNRLEPTLVNWIADLENTTVTTPDIMYTYDAPGVRLIATLDGITADNIPVEVKTTKKIWTGVLNRGWYWQGVQQAICAGSDTIIWGILDGNLEFHKYVQTVSSDEKGIHIEACREFLLAIDKGEIPRNATLNYSHIESMYPVQDQNIVEFTEDQALLIKDLIEVRDAKKMLDDQEDALKAQIGAIMQTNDTGVLNGKTLITWKSQSRSGFDLKQFGIDHPLLVTKYKKVSEYKTMKPTKGAK